jgi:hypothetical protein
MPIFYDSLRRCQAENADTNDTVAPPGLSDVIGSNMVAPVARAYAGHS